MCGAGPSYVTAGRRYNAGGWHIGPVVVVCQFHGGDSYRHGTSETGTDLLTLARASSKSVRGADVLAGDVATEVLAQD